MSKKAIQNLQSRLLELIFAFSTFLLLGLLLFAFIQKVNNVPNVAEYLPQNTQAFVAANVVQLRDLIQDSYTIDAELFGSKLQDWPGFTGKMAVATVGGDEVQMLKLRSRGSSRAYLDDLLLEDEKFVMFEGVACYEVSHTSCFIFLDNWFASSESVDALKALAAVQSGEPSLESSGNYQNVKSRLPKLGSAFIYVDIQESKEDVIQLFSAAGINETGFLGPIFRLFPSFGMTLDEGAGVWELESFLAVDKELLDGEAFYRPEEKYNGELLTWVSDDFMFQWGGQNLAEQMERTGEVFTELNPVAGALLNAAILNTLNQYVGLQDFSTFTGEFLIAFNPQEKPLILTKVDNEVQILSTPDGIQPRQNSRTLSAFEGVLNGSDEVMRVHMNFLFKRPIVLTTGRKVFDDGITTRSVLHFE